MLACRQQVTWRQVRLFFGPVCGTGIIFSLFRPFSFNFLFFFEGGGITGLGKCQILKYLKPQFLGYHS